MYFHYQRELNGKPNRGWLRTMVYSITQQLIRQDLAYYMAYVALRPNRSPRLVAYPYYTKYVQNGDSTVFRHININIPEFLKLGRGGNIIQGSVLLDYETLEGGCTALVLGFYRHLKSWWQRPKRGSPPTYFVTERRGGYTTFYTYRLKITLQSTERLYLSLVAV